MFRLSDRYGADTVNTDSRKRCCDRRTGSGGRRRGRQGPCRGPPPDLLYSHRRAWREGRERRGFRASRAGRLVLGHEEIKDFMAPMVMSYVVTPATLLRGLAKGDKVRFTIDADKRAIVGVVPAGK